jgi:uncharacterized protein (UPF0332 family)
MPPKQLIELSKLRLDNAKKLLETSQTLIDADDYKSSANRSYYAIFNAMRACLALHSIDYKRHSGVISDFRLHFIKSGRLETELSDIITVLFEMRNQSDYNDFCVVSKADVTQQLTNAKVFVEKIEILLHELWVRQ